MKKTIFAALAMATVAAPMALPAPALAQDWHHDDGRHDYGRHDNGRHDNGRRGYDGGNRYGWQGDRHDWDPAGSYHYDKRYRPRRLGRNDYVYRGRDGRYYCRRSDGTTGLVIGAIGGGLLGGAVGGNTLGALLGAGGGALLGRSIDRGNIECR